MSPDDLPEADLVIRSGDACVGVTSLAPVAFKYNHAGHATTRVPVVDAPIDTPLYYGSNVKSEKESLDSEASRSSQSEFVNGEPITVTREDI